MTNRKYKEKLDELILSCRKNLAKVDDALIRRAFEFGFNAHRHDKRASGEPFFDHPYEVAKIVAQEIPVDDISVAASLMHDVAEDTEYQIKDIRAEFGDTIAEIVDGATKISGVNFMSQEASQAENYRKLLLSMVKDARVMLVKFADRLHNMRTIDFLPPDKRLRIAHETIEIYAPFAHRFGLASIKWEMEDLAFKVLHRKDYDAIARELNARRRERQKYLEKFAEPIEAKLKQEGISYELTARPKHLYSIYNKMKKRNKPLSEIYDLFAVRIVINSQSERDCYVALGIVSSIYTANDTRFKDYINRPKQNGYKSIHTTVYGPEGRMVEVQIRTRGMHEIAERGVAAHWAYKEDIAKIDDELRKWMNWVRDIFEAPGDDDEPTVQIMESFKLSLFQEEIYVFTPKGDLKILPQNSTPVDFAYEIHSKVGDHCLAAKVGGKIVPLDTRLRSGDQVEIITSKNQTPNPDWEKFVVTPKARTHIRKWVKEEQRKAIAEGKAIWEKKLKKAKLSINEDDLGAFLAKQRIESSGKFFESIRQEKVDVDFIIKLIQDEQKHPSAVVTEDGKVEGLFNKFLSTARGQTPGGIVLNGTQDNFLHNFAKCCSPVPGDEVVGIVTALEGIKIHRRSCKNIQLVLQTENARVVDVDWPASNEGTFLAAVRIIGEDRAGMLSDITHTISSYQSTNIRSVHLDSKDLMFEGTFMLYVRDIQHLSQLMDKIRRIRGIVSVERIEQ